MPRWKISIIFTTVLIVGSALCTIIPKVFADELKIVLLVSHSESPYLDVLAGFQKYMTEQKMQAKCDVYMLENEGINKSQIFQEIKKTKPRLIFTIGTTPTIEALGEFVDVPIVATLVLSENTIKRARNATGVILDFPVNTQFYWLKSFLPEARRIGVMYNPLENQEKIASAEVIAKKMGLELNAIEIHTPKDIPDALKVLANNADVLWGINDPLVFNSLTAEHILLFSFRNRIPFCGLSSAWVKAGALYALEYDYHDIGVQCGEKAVKIIRGARVDSVPPSLPRKLLYALNLRTAKYMKIEIQEKHIRNAYKIFED
ncbi:MAG: ABC transporter substrate-binding protein [Candidatus Brocadia sp.]|nr:ABC transporter substrate-binding protein [Candidatus Brocadia sp.]NUO09595.1 ABC transporter substrate-binding protein [Candidatus Brocadia sp.]